MTINELYRESLKQLKNPEIEEINIRILICYLKGYKTMSDFYIHQNENIEELQTFYSYFARFLDGEPIQYILKNAYFFHREFYVDNRVLIPRQETEEVVEFAIKKAKEIFGNNSIRIADVCCGSGCIGISLSKALNYNSIYFTDISKGAIEVARLNCHNNGIEATFYKGDSLEPLISNSLKVDLIISNPPYILNRNDVDESAKKYEPSLALYSDNELSVYRKIIKNIKLVKENKLLVVFEIGFDLKEKLEAMIKEELNGYKYEFLKDINGKYRILSIYLE